MAILALAALAVFGLKDAAPPEVGRGAQARGGCEDDVAAGAAVARLPVEPPGSTITVTLAGLNADFDLYLFAPEVDEETGQLRAMLFESSARAQKVAAETMDRVRVAMRIKY